MRAIVCTGPGGPEVMQLEEVPDPVPDPGEVLVEVAAAGVNRADLLQRQGFYPPPPGAPDILGLECSGVVTARGAGVTRWQVGDEVCALLAGGAYAERVAVPEVQCLPVPAGVSLVEAAALPEVACTVWSNVVMVAGLRAGEVLLVHGGGSGIGTHAVQVGRHLGARVIVTAGSAEKLQRCLSLGATAGIDYVHEQFPDRVRELTDGHGADVILDIVGAKYLGPNAEALATGGRLVVIGLQGGGVGELNLGLLMMKRASVTAASLRARPTAEKGAIVDAVRERLWPAVASGDVRPIVDRVLPLAEAARAHELMAASEHFGKLLLTP